MTSGSVPRRQVGDYELQEELNSGSYGQVFRATRTSQIGAFTYALKLLKPPSQLEDAEKARARFIREVQVVQALQHRSIVNYLDAGIDVDGRPYLVMQLIVGKSIRDAVMPGDTDLAVRLMLGVLEGLAYAHKQDVLHRDLKPSNILVRDADQQPCIVDFGCAYQMVTAADQRLTTSLVGSIGYIPPEVVANPALRTVMHDVYACGIILSELIVGTIPNPSDYIKLTTTNRSLKSLDRVITKAIAMKTAERYQTIADFLVDLTAVSVSKKPLRTGRWIGAATVAAASVAGTFAVTRSTPIPSDESATSKQRPIADLGVVGEQDLGSPEVPPSSRTPPKAVGPRSEQKSLPGHAVTKTDSPPPLAQRVEAASPTPDAHPVLPPPALGEAVSDAIALRKIKERVTTNLEARAVKIVSDVAIRDNTVNQPRRRVMRYAESYGPTEEYGSITEWVAITAMIDLPDDHRGLEMVGDPHIESSCFIGESRTGETFARGRRWGQDGLVDLGRFKVGTDFDSTKSKAFLKGEAVRLLQLYSAELKRHNATR